MNLESVSCECGSKMYRVHARSLAEIIPLGYYCKNCGAIQNLKKEYLVSCTLITGCDPHLKVLPPYKAYQAIIEALQKNQDRAFYITNDMIDEARDQIGSTFHKFCREPGDHEPARLDREVFKKDLQKEFQNILKKHP